MSKDPQRTRLVKWWPISFAIAAIIFFVIGAALLGTYFNSSYSSCDDYYSYSYYSSTYCYGGSDGEFYGGIACIVIGGIMKLIAWILFIVWCVKRSRIQQNNITYVNNAPAGAPQQSYAAPQPLFPMQPSASFAPRSPASPGPGYAEAAGTPPPKEGLASATASKYCSRCGTAAHGRFCSQCGTQC
ncbi:hypothetical protein N7504_009021 [Penicillium tannophilum]|nr:hypothetical protein N7504_009021 [Penicillium tannophilum]